MEEHVSFDHIAKAWWIANDPDDPVGKDEKRASQFLEYLARRKFSEQHGSIEKDYWNKKPTAGCALTGDGYVHSVMNITDPELVLYEDRVHQLCRDVHRTFGAAAHPNKKAEKDLKDAAEMLYAVLTRVIVTASVLEKKGASQHEMDEALVAVRIQWKSTSTSVEEMIQRQARFEYLEGVGLGALITIPALAVAGWAAVHYGANQLNAPGAPGSLTAAIIGIRRCGLLRHHRRPSRSPGKNQQGRLHYGGVLRRGRIRRRFQRAVRRRRTAARQFWHLANHSGQTGCRETRRARTAAVRTAPPREDARLHPRAPGIRVNGNGILTL
jgi:hypothetical protein